MTDLAPFAQPAPSGDVTLATPTVDFNDVPTGLTVNRAARFNVNSALPVTFQIITAPTAPFAPANASASREKSSLSGTISVSRPYSFAQTG